MLFKVSCVVAGLFAGIVAGHTPTALAASFDCAKASTTVEKLICSNDELDRLDATTAQLFKSLKSISADKDSIVSEQKEWLKRQRNICKDVVCLQSSYKSRNAVLEEYLAKLQASNAQTSPVVADAKSENKGNTKEHNDKPVVADVKPENKGNTKEPNDKPSVEDVTRYKKEISGNYFLRKYDDKGAAIGADQVDFYSITPNDSYVATSLLNVGVKKEGTANAFTSVVVLIRFEVSGTYSMQGSTIVLSVKNCKTHYEDIRSQITNNLDEQQVQNFLNFSDALKKHVDNACEELSQKHESLNIKNLSQSGFAPELSLVDGGKVVHVFERTSLKAEDLFKSLSLVAALPIQKPEDRSTKWEQAAAEVKAKGEMFAQQVTRAWNVKSLQDKLTLKTETMLTGSQVDKEVGVRFDTDAKCTGDGGAHFFVAIYDDGTGEGLVPHKMTGIQNDSNPSALNLKAIQAEYANKINLGTFYYGIANWKKDSKILKYVSEHADGLEFGMALAAQVGMGQEEWIRNKESELARLMSQVNMTSLEIHHLLDDGIYRMSLAAYTKKGTAAYHLPLYNKDVRSFIQTCSSRKANAKP